MIPILLSALIPGTGLILVGRPWLGLALALLFGICAHTVLAGWLIAPMAWPVWLTRTALGMTIGVWIASMILLRYHRAGPAPECE